MVKISTVPKHTTEQWRSSVYLPPKLMLCFFSSYCIILLTLYHYLLLSPQLYELFYAANVMVITATICNFQLH